MTFSTLMLVIGIVKTLVEDIVDNNPNNLCLAPLLLSLRSPHLCINHQYAINVATLAQIAAFSLFKHVLLCFIPCKPCLHVPLCCFETTYIPSTELLSTSPGLVHNSTPQASLLSTWSHSMGHLHYHAAQLVGLDHCQSFVQNAIRPHGSILTYPTNLAITFNRGIEYPNHEKL